MSDIHHTSENNTAEAEDDARIYFFTKEHTISVAALRKHCPGFVSYCGGDTEGDTHFCGPASDDDTTNPIFSLDAYKDLPSDAIAFVVKLIEEPYNAIHVNDYYEKLAVNRLMQSVAMPIRGLFDFLHYDEAVQHINNDGLAHVVASIITGNLAIPHNHRDRPKTIISQLNDALCDSDVDDVPALRDQILETFKLANNSDEDETDAGEALEE